MIKRSRLPIFIIVAFVSAGTAVSADERIKAESILPAVYSSLDPLVKELNPGEWSTVASQGKVQYRSATLSNWKQIKAGSIVGTNNNVKTGPNGWALMARGKDRMVIGANSSLKFKKTKSPGITRIMQDLGNILFKVERKITGTKLTSSGQPERRFYVDTPYLMVGVKGTTFGVSVNNKKASVSVSKGTVSVSTSNDGQSSAVDVTAGETASVSQKGGAGNNNGISVTATSKAQKTKSGASSKNKGSGKAIGFQKVSAAGAPGKSKSDQGGRGNNGNDGNGGGSDSGNSGNSGGGNGNSGNNGNGGGNGKNK